MKKRMLALLCSALLLCGCSLTSSAESLISPPKLTDEQNEIYQALMSVKGSSVNLKYPKSGDYRSAFVIHNLDEDDGNEAIVFYETESITKEVSLWINFLDQKDGNWYSVCDMPALGTEIEMVSFEKLGDSKIPQIIIDYSISNQSYKGVSVLQYRDGSPEELFKTSCSYVSVLDANEDGLKEFFTIVADKNAGTVNANIYGFSGNKFTQLSSTPIDPLGTEYTNVFIGKISKGTNAIIIDHTDSDNTCGTDVLVSYSTRVENITYNEGKPSLFTSLYRRVNSNMPVVYSKDIDNDGIIEIAGTSVFPGYENLTKPEQCSAFIWYSIKDLSALYRERYTFIDSDASYMFTFPSRWEGVVTVITDVGQNEVRFYEWNTESLAKLENPLLSIKKVNEGETVSDEWSPFMKSEDKAIDYYIINSESDSSLSLTDDELKDSFRLLNQGD